MKEKNIDELIEKNLGSSSPLKEIDVRKETMTRIEAYEKRKAKISRLIQWALSAFTTIASLVSVYIFEIIFNHFKLFFLVRQVDIFTLKTFFQIFFILILMSTMIIMIVNLKSKKQLNQFTQSLI